MAEKSQKAADAVEQLFRRKPDATTDEFLEVAIAADRSLEGVGKRSFNASYLLPLKRAANPGKKKRKASGRKPKATGSRKKAGAGKRGRAVRVSTEARARLREMILHRDQQVLRTLGANGDAQDAYALGAHLDDYIDEIATTVRS